MNIEKCIWMEAGSVEYQLCPLKKNCDLCDFHKEMIRGCRTHSSQVKTGAVSLRAPHQSTIQFTPGLQYLHGHFWYKRVGNGRIRLGIDSFLWQLFAAIQKVVTPENKTILAENQCLCWLVLDGGIIYLKSPIRGKTVQSNPLFHNRPIEDTHLYLTPEPELWLVEMEVTDDVKLDNLRKEEYLTHTRQDCIRFGNLIQPEGESQPLPLAQQSPLSKTEFSKYLRTASNDLAFIC